MKVLHLGDIGDVPYILSKYLIKLGIESKVVTFREHRFKNRFDHNLMVDRFPRIIQPGLRLYHLLKNYLDYDIYHMHSSSWLPFYIDAPLLKSLDKKIVYHHHGHDVYVRRFKEDGSFKVTRIGVPLFSKACDLRLVSTPDLLDAVPDAEYYPNPFEVDEFCSVYRRAKVNKKTSKITVFHAPTDRNKKGTFFIERAIKDLQNEGNPVELLLCENKERIEFLSLLKESDIVVDQVNVGWYGMLSMEALAVEKPVIVYIRSDLKKYLSHGMPFEISSNLQIKDKIKLLLDSPVLRKNLQRKSKKYVEKVHSPLFLAKRLKKLYEGIL